MTNDDQNCRSILILILLQNNSIKIEENFSQEATGVKIEVSFEDHCNKDTF